MAAKASEDLQEIKDAISGEAKITDLPGVGPADYINRVLDYARNVYQDTIQEMGLGGKITVLVKGPNRRIYVMPRHNLFGEVMSKQSGAVIGSQHMSLLPGYHPGVYNLEKSAYIADKAVDTTGEGQQVIGAAERSMIVGSSANCRLAVNVTMNDKPPRMYWVEGVPILDIGSGLKALEAMAYFYKRLHG